MLVFSKKLYTNRIPDNPGGGTVDWTNPWVHEKFRDILRFWLDRGVEQMHGHLGFAAEEFGISRAIRKLRQGLAIGAMAGFSFSLGFELFFLRARNRQLRALRFAALHRPQPHGMHHTFRNQLWILRCRQLHLIGFIKLFYFSF